MWPDLPLFPEQASTVARQVDLLYFFAVAVTAFFSLLIAGFILYFSIRYRRRHAGQVGVSIHGIIGLEILWSVIPLAITMVLFFWGAQVFFTIFRPPDDARDYYVVGKQWMWKVQHPEGPSEINELHVPVDTRVRLLLTSEDVIHSFFIPAFRVKMDALPGRYSQLWFEATAPGEYHLFCAEYCGSNHSHMVGRVVVLEEEDYQTWLVDRGAGTTARPVAATGAELFSQLGCNTCHQDRDTVVAPSLRGLFGSQVQLADGRTIVADEDYIRTQVLDPGNMVTVGFQPVMPTFRGQVTEEEILQLIGYIQSLAEDGTGGVEPQEARLIPAQEEPSR